MLDGILKKISAEAMPTFAAIDFDNTCIVNDIEEALLAYMCENNLIRNQNLLKDAPRDSESHKRIFTERHKIAKEGSMEDVYLFDVKTLAGYTKSEIEELVIKTIRAEGEVIGERNLFGITIAKGIKPREKIFHLIKQIHNMQIPIWIITASSEVVVKAVLKYYNLDFPCIGLKLAEKNGKLTDEIIPPYSIGPGKVDCIKKYIDPAKKPTVAIGDSKNDLPMLEYAEIQIVVNRNNSLSEEAKKRNWFLISEV